VLTDTGAWIARATSALGLLVMLGMAVLLSEDRRRIPWRLVTAGVGLQLAFALLVLKTTPGRATFSFLNAVVGELLGFAAEGARFVFGDYLDLKFSVAFNVLPTIVFFSSLMAVLYHLRVVQPVVRGLAWLMQRTLRTSGAETLSCAANVFVGQTEAPLVVRPFLSDMTRSELMAVMAGGFATVAGGVMATYVGMLRAHFPDIAGHLVAASVMSAPAALVCAKVMVPEREVPKTSGRLEMPRVASDANVLDAAARGASEGLRLALNVAAMLVAFLGLVAVIDALVGLVWPGGSLSRALGIAFWPLAWVMGVPARECAEVASMLGEKTVLNEFVAYLHLARTLEAGAAGAPGAVPLSERSVVITTYALCGFSNFGSIGIQIGGMGVLAPERRADIARLGLRAMAAGSLACFMTAAVAGMLL
jgi:CNT family concentrative nucleoside transporter